MLTLLRVQTVRALQKYDKNFILLSADEDVDDICACGIGM